MGIRETVNQNPRVALGVMTGVVAIAVGYVVMQVLASRKNFPSKSPDDYFTTDDGKTFFTASRDNLPPFDYQGKQAVHAYVFECPGTGKRFVGYLERYTTEARKKLVETKAADPGIQMNGRELKKPGDTTWVKSSDIKAVDKIMDVRCPDGKPAEQVEPGV